jgi:N-acetylglucosamine-6-phosphate deacetylase
MGEKMKLKGRSVFSGKLTAIQWEGSRISGVEEIAPLDDELPWVSPGFIDIQVGGFLGSDYSMPDLDVSHVTAITGHLAGSGTTRHLPTIITSPADLIVRNLQVIVESREKDEDLKSAIPGIHMEGPFISGEDGSRGSHDKSFVRDPDIGEFKEWQSAAKGLIRLVTLAPERKGAISVIEKLVEEGVIPALGHTSSDIDTIHRAIAAGA